MSLSLIATPFITKPIQTYAKSFVTADGTKWETAPSDLPWAGSADRQGVLFYVARLYGGVSGQYSDVTPFTLAASNDKGWVSQAGRVKARIGGITSSVIYVDPTFHYPATYSAESGTWSSSGGDTKSYLEEEVGNGRQRWEKVTGMYWGHDTVDEIKKDRGKQYRICLESTAAFKPYTNRDGVDYMSDRVIYGTVYDIGCYYDNMVYMDISKRWSSGGKDGTANSKWIQSLANGMVFNDEEEAKELGSSHASVVKGGSTPSCGDLKSQGYGFATIKPTIVPIHTFNGTTPSEPEEPKPDITDGECSIYKVYYTQEYDKKGREVGGYKQVYSYSKHQTTNYIVIDSERGYAVEKWLHF